MIEILKHCGPARLGKLRCNDDIIRTPNFFLNLVKGINLNHDIYLASCDFKTKKKPVVYDCGSFFQRRKFCEALASKKRKHERRSYPRSCGTNAKFSGVEILPDEHAGLNVPRSIAEAAVRRTVEFAKNYPGQGAVIQGSKYIDLREKCARELEDRPLLVIANGAKLVKNPRLLVEIVTRVRDTISPNSVLYLPFAPPHMFYLLAYMGIDLFDSVGCVLKAREKKLITARGFLKLQSLKELPCSCEICKTRAPFELEFNDILTHNFNTAVQVVREIREAIRSDSMRELVEEKASCDAASMVILRLLDRDKQDFLEKYTAVSL
ncbi:MAG: tRNA-guanine transglycosylase [Candidatus Hydrothermarchaeota archaeon]|nr:tRNA-guanine transglycosylase [Candidatus Hydrothermarchaeota archaeon]